MRSPSADRPLRALHLANHGSTNIGNGALVSGLERTLREDGGGAIEFVHEAWDDYTIPDATKRFGKEFVELGRGTDCVIVGAAVTFVGSKSHASTGMRFDLPVEMWDLMGCPIVFYGLSYRTWPGQDYEHKDRLKAAIRHALEGERYLFSVRNDGTRAWLSRLLDMDCSGIHEVPDPALFVEADETAEPWNLAPGRFNVALSLNDEDRAERFLESRSAWPQRMGSHLHPSRAARRRLRRSLDKRRTFVRTTAEFLDRLARSYPVQIILCPHHHEDFRLIADLFDRCSSRLKHQIVVVNGLPRAETASRFYNFYRKVDLTLAMRVHAMSPSIGLGTPTLSLCSQSRMFEFMADAGLDEYAIDIFGDDFGERLWRGVRADPRGPRWGPAGHGTGCLGDAPADPRLQRSGPRTGFLDCGTWVRAVPGRATPRGEASRLRGPDEPRGSIPDGRCERT